jgi:hypothetical protein
MITAPETPPRAGPTIDGDGLALVSQNCDGDTEPD